MTASRQLTTTRRSAFTLLEMAVVLAIIGIVIGSAVTMLPGTLQKRQYQETQVKMAAIQKALLDYRIAFNRIPCPADVTLKLSDANFGVEGVTPGTCTTGSSYSTANGIRTAAASPGPTADFIGYPTPSGDFAIYAGDDHTTNGSWVGVYGADGYDIAGDTHSYPSYANVVAQWSNATGVTNWENPSLSADALQKGSNNLQRLAEAWYIPSHTSGSLVMTYDVDLTADGKTHQVSLYILDWDSSVRQEMITVKNSANVALDTRIYDSRNWVPRGRYLKWNVSGHVKFAVFTLTSNEDTIVSGLFFDPVATLPIVEGMVPTSTLRLPDDYAFDGWGRRMMYAASRDLTQTNGFTLIPITNGSLRISIKDGQATPAPIAQAAYALLSFGPNGHGAYPRGNGPSNLDIVTSRINAGSTNVSELENCYCDSSAASTIFNGIFIAKPTTQDSAHVLNSFDDVVAYGTRTDLSSPTE